MPRALVEGAMSPATARHGLAAPAPTEAGILVMTTARRAVAPAAGFLEGVDFFIDAPAGMQSQPF